MGAGAAGVYQRVRQRPPNSRSTTARAAKLGRQVPTLGGLVKLLEGEGQDDRRGEGACGDQHADATE